MSDIIAAVKNRDLDNLRSILLDDPSLADVCDEEGVAVAFVAAKTGDMSILRYMVEYSRAHMNIRDPKGRHMLHYGVMSNNLEVVRYLTERVDMSPLEGDLRGITPYDLAVSEGYEDIVRYFEEVTGASYDRIYKNPVRRGFWPDPSVVAVGDDYYMVNSSFIYFPAIPISHSRDMINWEVIGYAVTDDDDAMLDELPGGRGYWAADISYHDGRFFITATYRLSDEGTVYRRQMVVSSDKPEGPYSKPVFIDEDGIDPSIFVDDDGRKYMLLNRGARIFELNSDCTKKISDATLLYYGDNKRGVEGAHLLKKDGWYYLFLAEGGTGMGHRITVARSETLFGRYEPCPYNPILKQEDDRLRIQKAGHGKPILCADGNWYMVYLCSRPVKGPDHIVSNLGRETAVDRIEWTADGWPIVGNRRHPSDSAVAPMLGVTSVVAQASFMHYDDDFTGLDMEWMSVRSRRGCVWTADNKLFLRCDKYEPSDICFRGVLLRKQSSMDFDADITVCTGSMLVGEEYKCGLINYYDERTYVYMAVTRTSEDSLKINVVSHEGEDEVCGSCIVSYSDSVTLCEEVRGLERCFYVSAAGERKLVAALPKVDFLCDEGLGGGKRFTGATYGVFGVGEDVVYSFEKLHVYNRE